MKAFVLNLTTIIEHNAKIYGSIILGLVGCLVLLITEAVHVQTVVQNLQSQNVLTVREAIDPLIQRYSLGRYLLIILALIWSVYEYKKTKKKLGL